MTIRNRYSKALIPMLLSALVVAIAEPAIGEAPQFTELVLSSELVPSPVKVGVLLPPDYDPEAGAYPLLLLLHGGNGSSKFLEELRPSIEEAWASGRVPRMVIATPSASRSMYLDYRDGSQKWETFVRRELIPTLRETYRVSKSEGTFVAGLSMGGLGALRLAFKYPVEFRAAAAVAPAVENVLSFNDLQAYCRQPGTICRPDEFYWERFGKPVDKEYWDANHPPAIAQRQIRELKESGVSLYLEVGDLDEFQNYKSAELLHRILFDAGVKHEYRLLRGVHHAGESVPGRMRTALEFIGRVSKEGK